MYTSHEHAQHVFDISLPIDKKEVAIGILLSRGFSSFQELSDTQTVTALRIWTSPVTSAVEIETWFSEIEVTVKLNLKVSEWTPKQRETCFIEGFELTAEPSLQSDTNVICLLDGVGFGWGDHPTTRLGLRYLRRNAPAFTTRTQLLDFGAGTGVLTFAAIRLGVGAVDAVEIDDAAVHTLRRNISANQSQKQVSTFSLAPQIKYEHIVANVYANVLLNELGMLIARLKPTGQLWMSGYRRDAHDEIMQRVMSYRGEIVETEILDGWMSCVIAPKLN